MDAQHLASKIGLRYVRTGKTDDLEEAISLSRQAVQLTPIDNSMFGTNLYNLGYKLQLRYGRTGEI